MPNNGLSETELPFGQEPTNLLAWIIIAILVLFLLIGRRAQEPEDLKANIRRSNLDGDHNEHNGID